MRIGIDARMYSPKFTGIGRYNFELIKELLKQDKDNTYVLFMNSPEYEQYECTSPNVEKICVGAAYYSFAEQWKLPWILYKAKLDVMHFTHFNNAILYLKKQTVTIHDLTLSFFPGKKMTTWYRRFAYFFSSWAITRKAYRIIAISENTKKDLMNVLHVPEKKIEVIMEGATDDFKKNTDPTQRSILENTYGLSKPFLLYTGVWRDHKNVVGLIKAYHLLVTEKNFNADLVITGKKDPYYREVEDTILELGLSEHVRLVGLVPEEHLHLLYSFAVMYVFPSFYEGFGLTLLEAFAADLPVASSRTSSLPEVGGDACTYFDPYSTKDMAEKIYELYMNPEQQQEQIQKGRARLALFSWTDMAQKIHAIYLSARKSL